MKLDFQCHISRNLVVLVRRPWNKKQKTKEGYRIYWLIKCEFQTHKHKIFTWILLVFRHFTGFSMTVYHHKRIRNYSVIQDNKNKHLQNAVFLPVYFYFHFYFSSYLYFILLLQRFILYFSIIHTLTSLVRSFSYIFLLK